MTTTFKLDMLMMYAVHDAFRRDLDGVATMSRRSDGWDAFQRFLRYHHEAEDEALWPVLGDALAGEPHGLVLLDEMRAEHAALGPVLAAVDDALDRGDTAPGARNELAVRLEEHLTHEEEEALPIIDRTLDEQQWMQFGEAAVATIGPDMPTFLPWLLHGADEERTAAVLGRLPEPVQRSYEKDWRPAYAAKTRWAI
jgi:hypothetical protein